MGMNAAHPAEDPAIDGPDYVALVIEWDDIEDLEDVEDLGDTVTMVREPVRSTGRPLAFAVLGALGVLVLATWGVHRLTS